jgi:pyruvate kinase
MTKSSVGKAKNPESARRWHPDVVDPLVVQLSLLRQDMLELEQVAASWWQSIPDEHQCSGRNLLHYVSLRRHDIRELQEQLVLRGLSSLGRCESHVMENVEAVLAILSDQATQQVTSLPPQSVPVCFQRGRELLKQSTQRLFGKNAEGEPLIMVTMPGEAGADYGLVRDLLEAGMNSMRINCAHDDGTAWSGMIDNLRRAERELGRSCRVVMDLAGPKVRTGEVEEGPRVICWKPSRNEYGQVICPVRLWISSDPNAVPLYDAQLVIRTHDDCWKSVRQGDVLRLRDAGGRRRRLQVIQATDQGLLVESNKTAYITPKTVFKLEVREGKEGKASGKILGRIGDMPSRTGYLFLQEGDSLQITGADAIGHPARYDEHGRMISMASIGCTLPEVFAYVHPGERVLLDDGKISTVVTEASTSRLIVRVTRAGQKGTRLRADKGMNFPDTSLHLPALTDADVEN